MTQPQRYVYIYRPLRVIWPLSAHKKKKQSPERSNQSPFIFLEYQFQVGRFRSRIFYGGWLESRAGPDMVMYSEEKVNHRPVRLQKVMPNTPLLLKLEAHSHYNTMLTDPAEVVKQQMEIRVTQTARLCNRKSVDRIRMSLCLHR